MLYCYCFVSLQYSKTQKDMKTAIFTNNQTSETYKISSEDMNLEKAWNLVAVACRRMNWNEDTFCLDCIIRIK